MSIFNHFFKFFQKFQKAMKSLNGSEDEYQCAQEFKLDDDLSTPENEIFLTTTTTLNNLWDLNRHRLTII